MKFVIKKDKERDIRAIESFYDSSWSKVIKDSWPEIKSKGDIRDVIECQYDKNEKLLNAKIASFKKVEPKLQKVVRVISDIMNEDWEGIKEITADIAFCPVAPRNLKNHSFMLPVNFSNEILLNWSAHEMIHFLYFKKWQKIFPQSKNSNFEYPDPVWILSEIAAPIIAEDERIKEIIDTDSNIYDNWQKIRIEGMGLVEIFTEVYLKSNSFDGYLRKSWQKYQEIDKEFALTQLLISEM